MVYAVEDVIDNDVDVNYGTVATSTNARRFRAATTCHWHWLHYAVC